MQIEINEFIIRDTSVICPACTTPFATLQLVKMPNITPETNVEADLHRVLPDARVRGSLIAICPACIHTWWASAFSAHSYLPDLLVPAPEIEPPKKFAHAVLTGRNTGAHALDRALLALNGCWCMRETYHGADEERMATYKAENNKWLVLAAQELDAALRDQSWDGNRSRYSYLMGEVLRQLGDFHNAVRYFDIVDRRSGLPRELVQHQRTLAVSGVADPVRLPPHLVEKIFLPKPIDLTPPQPQIVQAAS